MKKKTKKRKTTKKMRKGTKYTCRECGLVVTVDKACGCSDVCDILCCGEQMTRKRPKKK